MKAIDITFLCLVFVGSEARLIQKCDLYYMLKEMGFNDDFSFGIQHLVCVALFSSEGNTEFYENENGVPYYGIFRLSGLEWCFNGRHISDNKCDIECDKLLDDNINDDVQCAKEVIASNAFESWPRYQEICSKNWVDIIKLVCTHGLHSEMSLSKLKNKHKRKKWYAKKNWYAN
ncbi:hypothetical protein lerEdw1_005514 [Lerista edwardsae]|nr:hypothetical protein lerEdw1_005514 [Lerista edwardsae]